MPTFKLKDWKGLYTNRDENEVSFEFAKESINFRHSRGALFYESRNIGEYSLPEIDPSLSAYDWKWETGIYSTLLNDPLAENPVAKKYDTLVVIAKAEDNGKYHRLIFLKDLTNNSIWYELSKYGNVNPTTTFIENHNGSGSFDNSYFTTTIDGKAFLRVEDGRLKVFLPHDCFWIGRSERQLYFKGEVLDVLKTNQWYIDRLQEPFDEKNLTMFVSLGTVHRTFVGNPLNIILGPETLKAAIYNSPGRRNAIKFNVNVITDPGTVINERPVTKVFKQDNVYYGFPDLPGTHDERWNTFTYELRLDNNPIPCEQIYSHISPPGPLRKKDTPNEWHIYKVHPDVLTDYVFLDPQIMNAFKPLGKTWEQAAIDDPNITLASEWKAWNLDNQGFGWHTTDHALMAGMPRATFDALPLAYVKAGRIEDIGIANEFSAYNIVATAVYDNREEYILESYSGSLTGIGANERFALEISKLCLPWDFNRRTTKLRFYAKFYDLEGNPAIDHTLYKEFDLLDEKNETAIPFHIYYSSESGVQLSQNIGVTFDDEKPQSHRVVTGFRDVATEGGVSVALATNDYSSVYYSSLGGGNLLPDLIYNTAIVPIPGVPIVNAVTTVNTKLALLSDNTLFLIEVLVDAGVLAFAVKSMLEFGVKDFNDIAQIQGGIAIHTMHGIYTTTGNESNLISEPIDDIVKANFKTGKIYYNKYLHELYYKPTNSEDLYRFRFKDAVWEKINKTVIELEVEDEAGVLD